MLYMLYTYMKIIKFKLKYEFLNEPIGKKEINEY
jgi:hypothetical protein